MKLVARAADELKIENVSAFVATAESGSFSQAAVLRGCSQSMLSRRVLELEEQLGGRLFNRTGRGVLLTELGVALLPVAQGLLDGATGFLELASSTNEQPSGTVEIALPRWAAEGPVSMLVNRITSQFPRIHLVIHESYSRDVMDRLAAGKLDIGVFNSCQPEPPAQAQRLFSSDLVLLGRRDSPLLRDPTVPLAALNGLSIVMPPSPNPVEAVVRERTRDMQLELRAELEINSGAMIREVVRRCGRHAITQVHRIEDYLDEGDLAISRIVEPALTLHTFCATGAKHRINRASLAVERCLVAVLGEHFVRLQQAAQMREARWAKAWQTAVQTAHS
ncbi:LysR family transcriptional regulator [Achromobacter xylosoxidans]|uniref:LysR family transcriptional regulator n=1 Tax=Alcaligenes xylosoxydans xylosoxydans TaxID=85698 RepID=UPI0015C693CA|nr:LysR family transcriptional regulator [Achromobacter xylosoxidans]